MSENELSDDRGYLKSGVSGRLGLAPVASGRSLRNWTHQLHVPAATT